MEKDKKIEDMLSENKYISGQFLAQELGISRNAVWKRIKKLNDEGYCIEAVPNKGYKICDNNDVLSASCIRKYINNYGERYSLNIYSEITSTNNVLKDNADTLPDWSVAIADSQTSGRGRKGRDFVSPHGTGIYLSIFLRPKIPADKAVRITTAAAVAACRAIEENTDSYPTIKWVNDIFVNQKKVCGILTEGSLDVESGLFNWAVMGIGFNVYLPTDGFPPELSSIAGAITDVHKKDLRSKIAASFLNNFASIYDDIEDSNYIEEYRKRSFLIGRNVDIIGTGKNNCAKVLDIDDECGLVVQLEDGSIKTLSSGEVSVRLS